MPGPAPAEARLRATAAYLLNATFAGSLGTAAARVEHPGAAHEPTAAFICALLALAAGKTDDGLATLEPHLKHPDPWTRGMLWFTRSLLHGAAGRGDNGRLDIAAAVEGFRGCGERGVGFEAGSGARSAGRRPRWRHAVKSLEHTSGEYGGQAWS